MNTKILKQVGFMALGAVVARGVAGLAPSTTNPKLVHGGLAGASAVGAMKVSNPDLQSALIGATVVKTLDLGKSLFEGTTAAANLQAKTDKASAFLRSATGLGCPCEDGLGYANYLNGASEMYIDEQGNVVGLGFPEEEYLNGVDEELAYLNGAENDELSVL
jgi:hypothetical protein